MLDEQTVADFLGRPTDSELLAMGADHLKVVTAMARAYTRGEGFIDGEPNEELEAVITTATARLVTNADQSGAQAAGPFSRTPAVFNGWTLAETFVLNRYRRRAV